jgi:hypothetical protein
MPAMGRATLIVAALGLLGGCCTQASARGMRSTRSAALADESRAGAQADLRAE